jgi:hypothetical protein
LSYKYIDIRPNPVTGIGSYQRGFAIKDFVDLPQVEHRRIGGDWKAQFRIYANDRNLAEDLLFLGVGREVKIYNDKGLIDFGGMIYVVTLNTGGSKVRASLLDTSNRVWARWQEAGTANPPDRSAVFGNTASQKLYGAKEEVWNAGQQVSLAEASQYAEKQLSLSAWPTPRAIEISPGKKLSDRPILDIVCYGWWHTLSHVRYNQTALAGGINSSALIEDILGPYGPLPVTPRNNLISWWTMDEESGMRVDSYGTNDLSDINTVLYAAGKVNNAADFEVGNNEYLSHVDNADLSFAGNDPFTIACWVNQESQAGGGSANRIVSKSAGAGNHEYRLSYLGTEDRFTFEVSQNGNNVTQVDADDLGAPALSTWYFVVAWHDPVADVIAIQVNNGTPDTAAHATGIFDGTSLFCVGILNAGEAQGFDGLIDEVGLWNRVLTASERTTLYNDGYGIGYDSIGGVGQFIRSVDIEANATQIEQTIDADMGADAVIKSIVDMGDPQLNTWVAGVDHTREFYYRKRELER